MAAPRINNAGIRPFKRAEAMKQNGDHGDVVEIHDNKNIEKNDNKNTLPPDEENNNPDAVILGSFSNKFGMPFSPNNRPANRWQQSSNPTSSNGDTTYDNNNNNNNDKPPPVNPFSSTARERFRNAGLKARLAYRMEKIVEDRMTIKQIFNRYVDNSTLHGFRFIFMDTYIVRRLLWLALTVVMAVLFFTELRNSIRLYNQYPFTTLSTTEYVANLKFPAVSICNLNSFDVNKINKSKLKKLYQQNQFPFTGEAYDAGYDLSGKELISALEGASQDLHDILQSCEWKSRDTAKTGKPNVCGPQNFTRFSNMENQNCFTFNGGDIGEILTLNETGLTMAFKLEFDLRANKSLNNLEEVGVKIVIHDQSETPLHHAGFVVSPGFQTFVEMKVKKVSLTSAADLESFLLV